MAAVTAAGAAGGVAELPPRQERADAVGVPPQQLLEVARVHRQLLSLHKGMAKEDRGAPSPLSSAVKTALTTLTEALLATAPPPASASTPGDSASDGLHHYMAYVRAFHAHDLAKQIKGLSAIRKYLKTKVAEDKVKFHNAHAPGATYEPSKHAAAMASDLERVTSELKRLRKNFEEATPTKAAAAAPLRLDASLNPAGFTDPDFPSFSMPTSKKKLRMRQQQQQQERSRSPPFVAGTPEHKSPAHVSRVLARVFASPERDSDSSLLSWPPRPAEPIVQPIVPLNNHSDLQRSLRLARRSSSSSSSSSSSAGEEKKET